MQYHRKTANVRSSSVAYRRIGVGARSLVDTYAVVLRREELFQAGGRPVIYGLTGEPLDAQVGDPEFGMGYRVLKSACLPLREQYRYVTTGIGGGRSVDWTHEREWRWADLEATCDPPGLAIWLKEPKLGLARFSFLLRLQTSRDRYAIP